MAVDFDAIRKKLSQLSGNTKKKNAFWRPEQDSDYSVRIVPFTDNDGQPFKERYFYYGIGKNRGLLAPYQFGKPDPFQELITKLRDEGSKESYELAKKLYPKMRAYAAVIVRGEEAEGPRLWSFGKMVYQQLLNVMLDEDYGDITDPSNGRDIKVKVTKPPGAQWAKTEVLPRGKQTVLSTDESQIETWLNEVPDLDEIYALKSYEELEKIINDWLTGADEDDLGTEKGGSSESSSDTSNTSSSTTSQTHSDLDSAFEDLMKDD